MCHNVLNHRIIEKLELMFPIFAFNTVVRSFAESHLKLSFSKSQIVCKFKPIMTMLKPFDLLGDACTCISFRILGMLLILYGLVKLEFS